MASAGDLNGDGFDDLIVGEYLAARAHVYLGSAAGIGSAPDLTLVNPLEPTASAFGWVVATAGDLNGDGFADVAVGAQSQDNPTNAEGAVFVYFGSAAGLGSSPAVIQSPSLQELGQFGFSLAGSADIDGDGLTDLLVGSPSYDATTADEGIAYVFRGRVSGVETVPGWTIPHPNPVLGGQFGRDVAIGDMDGDGLGDVAVAAPFADDGVAESGAVWLFAGTQFTVAAPAPAVAVVRPTTEANGWFGNAIAFAADVNGDGLGDLVIGSPGVDSPSANEGLVVFVSGEESIGSAAAGGRIVLPPEPQSGASFGWSVAAGDTNGDGFWDVVVGAPFHDRPESAEGNVFVLSGSAGGVGGALGAPLDPADEVGANFGWWVGRAL